MNVAALLGLGLLMTVLQTTAFRFTGMSEFKAPLALCVVIYAAFHLEAVRALILAFLLGYAVDVFAGGGHGITSLVMVLLCLMGQWMGRGIFVNGLPVLGFVGFFFGLVHGILWIAVGALVEGGHWLDGAGLWRVVVQSMVLGLTSPLLVRLGRPVDRWSSAGWRRLQGRKA
jgi:rod shape-determining protein MreD